MTSYTVHGLPRSHWQCHTDTFVWDAVRPKALRPTYNTFLTEVHAGQAPHLLLMGRPGMGKTHLGVAAYREVVAEVGTAAGMWLNVPSFCDRVKSSYSKEYDPFAEYQDARRFVVLDDLFGRDLSSHEASQIVYRLLDIAYLNGAGMLVTMNQTPKELAARLPPHEISRLLAGAKLVEMTADKDWRRT